MSDAAGTGGGVHPPLQAAAIAAAIGDLGGAGEMGSGIEVVAETASTNDLAMTAGRSGVAEGWCVFAESQTAGRGRRGDPWVSPARRDLLFSIVLRPLDGVEHWPRLPQLAAVALCRTLDHLAPALRVEAQIKWPNDIWLDGRKTAGLLVDTCLQGEASGPFAVLGIGLNVNSGEFSGELAQTATSLRLASGGGVSFDRNQVAARLLVELSGVYPQGLSDEGFPEVRDLLHTRSCLLGRTVEAGVAGRRIRGEVAGFGERGELILRTESGAEEVLHSAEEVRPISD